MVALGMAARQEFATNRDGIGLHLLVAVTVAVLHLSAGGWLLRYSPLRAPVRSSAQDEPLQVVFIQRREKLPSTPSPKIQGPQRSGGRPLTANADTPTSQPAASDSKNKSVAISHGPLNLTLPDEPVVIGTRDIFSEPKAIDYTPTRFDRHWKPQGDVITQLAWEHKAIGFVVRAMGGGRPICSEEERRQGKPGCPPLLLELESRP